jgi:hypothetical protein
LNQRELYLALQAAATPNEVETALERFEATNAPAVRWVPVGGREVNRGNIEVSGDPGRALVERVTNGIDAALEAEHDRHRGLPVCWTPKEAARAWLNVPDEGLSGMTTGQRRSLAERVTVRLLPGAGRAARVVEVIDRGIGLAPHQMPGTILSLNESNKIQKHYLAGTYGQGGSSTFAASQYTVIASRGGAQPSVGFAVVRYLDVPPEEAKTGHYVYLTINGVVLEAEIPPADFPVGTVVRHVGYDLSGYQSPLGPTSLYGLLNQVLFDPVMPVWLDSRLHGYRRVIKGSRNALNGAIDEGDEGRGPALVHNVRLFYVALPDFGHIGIEYWVLGTEQKKPTAAYVNPNRPIILTINGQNQAELSVTLVKNDADLPFLRQRLICHVDCNSLTPTAKRALFVSNREDARRGMVYDLIKQEVVRVLRSDDELTRLNNEARERDLREEDQAALQHMRREVARLLRLQGLNVAEAAGEATGREGRAERPTHPRPPRPKPQPIELHEPPTYIRLVWEPGAEITFYPQQRRYLRVETDASSEYHNAQNPAASRLNVIITGAGLKTLGSTPLQGGRLRIIVETQTEAMKEATGAIRVELTRAGRPTLADERPTRIVETPPARPDARQITLPPFRCEPVNGPDDPMWSTLDWPENVGAVASTALMDAGTLVIYFSTVFPRYANQMAALERRDAALAHSFTERYKIWLAVHSLMLRQQEQENAQGGAQPADDDPDQAELRERQERCRVAVLSALFAAREVQLPAAADVE